MTKKIPQFLNEFLSPHLPEATYRLNADGFGSHHTKEKILDVAEKLFQGYKDEITPHEPMGDTTSLYVPFHGVNRLFGKLEIHGKIEYQNFSGSIPEKIAVSFDDKKFSCSFKVAPKHDGAMRSPIDATCSATDRHRQVVVGGQWVSFVPYLLFFGTICYSAHSAVEGVQLCRSIIRVVSTEVSAEPSENRSVMKSVKLFFKILQDRNKIQISEKETLGRAVNRIGKTLLTAGLLSVVGVAVLAYDLRYVRV
jgi:hypothetical protein